MVKLYKPTPEQITAWVNKHFHAKPRKNGSELVICNPFDGDTGYNLNISTTKGVCHDWRGDDSWAGPINPRTGKHNCSFVYFVKLYLNCSYSSAIQAISDVSGSHVPFMAIDGRDDNNDQRDAKERPLMALPGGSEPLINSTQKKMALRVTNWLHSRGVSDDLIKLAKIHHLGSDAIFPYYEYEQLVYWQQRSLLNKSFLFPDEEKFGVGKAQFLYNFDNIEPASYIIVTESIFCCYSLGAQCVATGGADMSITQAKKVKLIGPKDGVILAPDNDAAAIRSIIKNAKLLSDYNLRVFISIPPALEYYEDGHKRTTKDWNELEHKLKMTKAQVRSLFENGIMPLDEQVRFKLLQAISKENVAARKTIDKIIS